ncbi:MAG: hypothetical protein KIH08_00820 [Candidatus Freyarchaeota archaeon]|nr:hypothetical protein [Candidatus Jordarchaeia archaeon]MBS7267863.1 hypothetical protein [Candidatus Jordarchaeia archaeon]MBS7280858.1 hypothetical protein [Candidatus Jordarchaeia archaeon]
MQKSKKQKIINRLSSPFSYTSATIPKTVQINGKEIKLESIVEEFKKREKTGNLTRGDIVFGATLSRLLEKEILKIINKIEGGQISVEEAEGKIDLWLGMLRASKMLRIEQYETSQREVEKLEKVAYVKWAKKFMDPELFSYRW